MNLAHIPLFTGLQQGDLERIEQKVVKRIYPERMIVFSQGQETDGLYIIESGLVKVVIAHSDGRQKTLAILNGGEILGEVTLYGSELRSASVETLEPTTFLIISKKDFRRFLKEIPDLAMQLIELLSSRLRRANSKIEELTFYTARSRIICSLLVLVKEHGHIETGSTEITLNFTHSEVARFVGVARQTVTKILNELQEDRIILTEHRKLRVLDLEKLKEEVV